MPPTIPLDDQEVMSLFQSTEALGIKPEDIGGCQTGMPLESRSSVRISLMQMLTETPSRSHFSDLVRIAGLAHGTDVWLGNAQTLIQEGKGNHFHSHLYPR